MDRNDRLILILGALALVLLVVIYYFLLLSPLRQDYLSAFQERTQKEASEQQLEQTVAQLENIRRNASDIERQILEYSKRVPEQAEIPTLVVQVEEVAEDTDVTQLSIEPGTPEAPPNGGDFSRIPLAMSFEGNYDEMQNFVLGVQNLARLVTINEVTYEQEEPEGEGGATTAGGTTAAAADGAGDDLLTVSIAAETYVQPAAGGDTAAPAGGGATAPAPSPAPAPAGGDKAGGKAKAKAGGDKGGGAKAGGGKS